MVITVMKLSPSETFGEIHCIQKELSMIFSSIVLLVCIATNENGEEMKRCVQVYVCWVLDQITTVKDRNARTN
jgi:hypothetical protein